MSTDRPSSLSGRASAIACAGALAWCACARSADPPLEPLAAGVERGVALGLFASDPHWDYAPLLDEVAAIGATDVQLDVVWEQSNVRAIDIARAPGISPSDVTVLRTIEQARERGLRVTLFPIVRPREHMATEWRGVLAPSAGIDAWFSAYASFLLAMADLAERGGAARLSVGSELSSLEAHEAHWRALIAQVRNRFSGALLYSANWDHLDAVRFWDALDVAGASAYFELARPGERVDAASLRARWREPLASLRALKQRAGLPLVVTELGYPAHALAAAFPWDETRRASLDVSLQAALLHAGCGALGGAGFIDGVTVWNWFGVGGASDRGYTPRGKPAAHVLARCFLR